MPRKLLRRYIPDHHTVRNHKHLRIFGNALQHPNLWHLNRHSVSGAFAVGLFMAWMPMPLQMFPAAAAAILFQVNLPIAIALVWLTNPITMPPLFWSAYLLGAQILDEPVSEAMQFEVSWAWLQHELGLIWEPFLLGCLILGAASGLLGYIGVRLYWKWHVAHSWKLRRSLRHRKNNNKKGTDRLSD